MNLVLGDDGGGHRHFLDGKPVRCGTQLRLFVGGKADDQWRWARYEANLGDRVSVILYTTFGIVIPSEDTVLRWAKEGE